MNVLLFSIYYFKTIFSQLNGTQLICLHLCLHRPGQTRKDELADPLFAPYISMLPQNFDSHPLTWSVKRQTGAANPHELKLLDLLPPSSAAEIAGVSDRFWSDWAVVSNFLASNMLTGGAANPGDQAYTRSNDDSPKARFPDFLWAWSIGTSTLTSPHLAFPHLSSLKSPAHMFEFPPLSAFSISTCKPMLIQICPPLLPFLLCDRSRLNPPEQ